MKRSAIVVGSGLGGLSGALHLATKGFRVMLFEKNDTIGGKMNEVVHEGFRFDTGPSLLTMPFVIDELFASVGKKREDTLEFVPVDPVCRYFFSDGSSLETSSDHETMKANIAAFAPGEEQSYEKFFQYSKKIYDLTADIFLFTPFQEVQKLFKPNFLPTLLQLPKIDPFRTIHKANTSFFRDQRLVQLFDRYATYNGSNPFVAPATLNIIPYVEHGLGGYYIRGGMYRLPEAILQLVKEAGVELHLSSPVEKILHNGKTVQGVVVDGEQIRADYVLCNADVAVTFNDLIDHQPRPKKAFNALEPSISGMVFLWSVQQEHASLAHHNILFSGDYQKEFQQIFDDLRAPDDPTVYIAITSKTDGDHAPDNAENWFVLLNMPYLCSHQDWEKAVSDMRQAIFRQLRNHGINIEQHILHETVLTPEDFSTLYASNRGSIYGFSSNDRNAAFMRPPNRNRSLERLYFCGGSSHPGGGIPLVLLSGKLAAELIVEHAGL
jgi:phytoene desaturase